MHFSSIYARTHTERAEYQGKSVQHRAKARDKLSFKVNPPPKPSIQRNLQLLQLVSQIPQRLF